MKKIFAIFLFCIGIKTMTLNAAEAFAQLSGLTSQVPQLSGKNLIRMDTVDAVMNLELSPDKENIIIKEPGTYFIMTAVQVGSIDLTMTGYVDIWLMRNQQQVANTTNRSTIDLPTSIHVLISQVVLPLEKDDKIAIAYNASGPSLGIVFLRPDLEPAIPSVVVTIFKL